MVVTLVLSGIASVAVAAGLLGVAWLVIGPILIGLGTIVITSPSVQAVRLRRADVEGRSDSPQVRHESPTRGGPQDEGT